MLENEYLNTFSSVNSHHAFQIRSIPFISAEFQNDPSNGLIKKLREQNIIYRYLNISTPLYTLGDVDFLFSWGNKWQLSSYVSPSFIYLSFHESGLKLSGYSIKAPDGICYAKQWYLYGFNEHRITYLGEGGLDDICGHQTKCLVSQNDVFQASVDSSDIFNSILFVSKNGSCTNSNHFSGSGFELYGSLYKLRPILTCSHNSIIHHSLIYVILMISK